MKKNKIELTAKDDNNIDAEKNSSVNVSHSQNYMNDYIDNVISRAQISVNIPVSEHRIIIKSDPNDGENNVNQGINNIDKYIDCVSARANSECAHIDYERVANKKNSVGKKIIASKVKRNK